MKLCNRHTILLKTIISLFKAIKKLIPDSKKKSILTDWGLKLIRGVKWSKGKYKRRVTKLYYQCLFFNNDMKQIYFGKLFDILSFGCYSSNRLKGIVLLNSSKYALLNFI